MFGYLKSELMRFRIIPQRRNDCDIYNELRESPSCQNEIDAFLNKIQIFLSHHKNNQFNKSDIEERLRSDDIYTQKRNELFLRIYLRIQSAYEYYLYRTRQFDFADMINAAEQCVREIPECAHGYKYILLDEVQDLSKNRLLLIKAILRKNPGCKLFAVGDDWQSIYRFTSSDLSLIHNFEESFGLTTRRSFIETTHRFGQPTIKISCDFIQRNPAQSHKNVHNIQKTETPIRVILNKPTRLMEGQDAESLQIILQTLIMECGYDMICKKTLQVISRYNHDIKRIKSDIFKITTRSDGSEIYDIE